MYGYVFKPATNNFINHEVTIYWGHEHIYKCIYYHISNLRCSRYLMSFLVENKDRMILSDRYHSGWWFETQEIWAPAATVLAYFSCNIVVWPTKGLDLEVHWYHWYNWFRLIDCTIVFPHHDMKSSPPLKLFWRFITDQFFTNLTERRG